MATYSLSVKFGPVQLKIWFQWFDSLASLCIIVPSQSLVVTVDAYIAVSADTVVTSPTCAAQWRASAPRKPVDQVWRTMRYPPMLGVGLYLL